MFYGSKFHLQAQKLYQRQNIEKYELVQDKCLGYLGTIDNMEQTSRKERLRIKTMDKWVGYTENIKQVSC